MVEVLWFRYTQPSFSNVENEIFDPGGSKYPLLKTVNVTLVFVVATLTFAVSLGIKGMPVELFSLQVAPV